MLPYVAAVVAVAPTFLYIPFYIYLLFLLLYKKNNGNIGNKP
jgi:hypothetical protein